MNETLRVKGKAEIVTGGEILEPMTMNVELRFPG